MWRLKRFRFTLVALVVVAGSVLAYNYFGGPSSKDCAPVRELLSFNRTQTDLLNSKTHIPEQGSYQKETMPSDMDYRNWADGLADRASKVTAPDLAAQARDVAQTSDRLVRARIELSAQERATAPGAPAPPVAMAVSALYDQFQAEVGQLSKSCAP